MSRKHKYKAWLNFEEEMVNVALLQFDENSPFPKPCILDEHNTVHYLKDLMLMEYTGFKDHSKPISKEIYNYSILKCKIENNVYEYVEVVWAENEGRYEVVSLSEKPLRVPPRGDRYLLYWYLECFECKEVGNRFANPELLQMWKKNQNKE